MIRCPVCKTEHPENTLFCDQCASYLQGGDGAETDPLGLQEGTATCTEREKTKAHEEELGFPVNLKFSIPDSGCDLEMPLTKGVTIGRLDAPSASFPDVDLSSEGGLEKGISRRHAKITRRGREVVIEDLGSINGTFLNHKKLAAYSPEALKSGDELQLGRLILRVSFTQ